MDDIVYTINEDVQGFDFDKKMYAEIAKVKEKNTSCDPIELNIETSECGKIRTVTIVMIAYEDNEIINQ